MADNISHWQGGEFFHKIKKYGNGHTNSGPSGRRKTKARNVMARELAGSVRVTSVIIWCNDQSGCQGTGYRGKYQG